MDGAGIYEVMRLGAAAAQLGTAFVGCDESLADAGFERRVAAAGCGVVATACDLPREILTADFGGSVRAGVSALSAAVRAVQSRSTQTSPSASSGTQLLPLRYSTSPSRRRLAVSIWGP